MIGLLAWTRSFTYKDGQIVRDPSTGLPVFAAHPQPNLYELLTATAKDLAVWFDAIQLPVCTEGWGEGYAPFDLRSFNSNWGTYSQLMEAISSCEAVGLMISPDLAYRQMSGENGGPGVFRYPDGIGDTTASWFQYFGQTGETIPPFVEQDSVPDPSGNFPFGRVRSYQHCIPAGVTEADTISAMGLLMELFK